MKVFAWVALGIAGVTLIGQWLAPVEARAMEQASNNLTATEQKLQTAVSTTATKALAVEEQVQSPNPQRELNRHLQDFTLAAQRLTSLREHLSNDISAYDDARAKKLDEFNSELARITDPTTRRAMERLRRHAEEQAAERLALAREALATLDQVLAQGADLQHAARCVLIADDFNSQGQDLEWVHDCNVIKKSVSSWDESVSAILTVIYTVRRRTHAPHPRCRGLAASA